MRYLLDSLRTEQKSSTWGGGGTVDVVYAFFCNSGTTEQRSPPGLRSLLYQVLQKMPKLIQHALPEHWEYEIAKVLRNLHVVQPRWSFPKLEMAFHNLVSQNIVPLKLCILIDGLVEYGHQDSDFSELTGFCNNLTALPNIKDCVSNRPLVNFSDAFDASPGLMLHRLTFDDIRAYTTGKLKTHARMVQLEMIEPTEAPKLVLGIVEAANGVFLRVKRAVSSLLQGLRNHDRISDLQKRLRLLPRDLEEFYWTMWERVPHSTGACIETDTDCERCAESQRLAFGGLGFILCGRRDTDISNRSAF